MRSAWGAWIAAAVSMLPSAGNAETHAYPLSEARVIVSPAASARVLLHFGPMADLEDVLVTSAFLEVPLPEAVREQDLEVGVYALTRAWSGQEATWTSPWTRAGGDLDETYFDAVRIPAGQTTGTLRLNVTQVVDEIVTEGAPNHGFVLTVPAWRGEGFPARQRERLGTMAAARLVVTTANARAAGVP